MVRFCRVGRGQTDLVLPLEGAAEVLALRTDDGFVDGECAVAAADGEIGVLGGVEEAEGCQSASVRAEYERHAHLVIPAIGILVSLSDNG